MPALIVLFTTLLLELIQIAVLHRPISISELYVPKVLVLGTFTFRQPWFLILTSGTLYMQYWIYIITTMYHVPRRVTYQKSIFERACHDLIWQQVLELSIKVLNMNHAMLICVSYFGYNHDDANQKPIMIKCAHVPIRGTISGSIYS